MSQSYSAARHAPIETRNLKHSPNCVFYVNGDNFFPGSRLCISNRIRTFDAVKDEITKRLFKNRNQPGSVRNIFTPTHGHRINSIDDFEDGQEYVASLSDKFQPLPYREIPERQRVPRHKGFKKIDINKIYTPVQHAFEERLRKKSGRSFYLNEQNRGLILRVHVNGYNERPACPVAIRCKERDNMHKIKEAIESVLSLQPIDKICCIINCGGYVENFVEVHDASELEHMGHYLVLPKNDRKLKPKLYSIPGKHNFSVATSPRSGQYYLYPSFPWDATMDSKQYKHNQSLNKHKPLPSIGSSSKQSDAVSPFSNPPSQHGRGGRRSKGRAQNVDYDKDEGGLYRARGQNNARGAQQVKDTYETHTERPIDQMEAEEVEEERLHTEKGTPIPPGTELNKQPSIERKQSNKGTEPLNEVTTDSTSREQGGFDSTTYRITEQSAVVDNQNIVKEKDSIREESVVNRDQSTDADLEGGQNDDKDNENEGDPMGNQIKDENKDNVDEDAKDNEKGQTTDWDDDAVPKQENVEDENVVQNKEIAPDKRSTGSQVYTPPNQMREEERTSEDQGIHRIDEFDDESFGADENYGGNSSLNKSLTNNPRASTPQSRNESRRKRREDEAATRIQAGVQGYQARKEHAQREAEREQEHERDDVDQDRYDDNNDDDDELRRRQDEAATKIQAGYKGYKYRKDMNANKSQVSGRDSVEVEKNINDSATRIQAGYQGYKARKDYNTRKTFTKKGEPEKDTDEYVEMQKQREIEEMQKQCEDEAATKLQAGYRGYKARKDYNNRRQEQSEKDDKKEEEKAAVKIQAGYRGYQTRKAYAAQKEARKVVDDLMSVENVDMNSQRNHDAATKIQAGYKGYRTRKNHASVKANKEQEDNQREAAATRIQAGYKGYKTRKNLAEKTEENTQTVNDDNEPVTDDKQEAAATKIQAGYRGYKTRKELKSQVTDGTIGKQGNDLEVEIHPDSVPSIVTSGSSSALETGSNKGIVTKLQGAFKAYKERKMYLDTRSKANAAVKIQAACRGFKIRLMKGLTSRKIEFEEFKKYKAAMKIRSVFSGYLERKQVRPVKNLKVKSEIASKSSWIKNSEIETSSIRTPQGPSYDGSEKSYWEDSHIKMFSDDVRNEAATKIQSAFFSFYTRKKYYAWKARQANKLQASKKIQACFKGYLVRKEKNETKKLPEVNEEFPSVREPKSAVEIYGKEKEPSEPQLSSNNIDRKLSKDLSDKDSCFTDNNSVSEIYQREKSLGYETIVSISGEVEIEGDSIKEIEDEAGELNAIEKHVKAIAALQSAVRAYKIRKEFQELLSGGGELIDIAKVDRAISALRKEFKYRSAKVRRLAAQQFESSNESNWWDVETSNAATLISLSDDSGTRSSVSQQNTDVNIFILDPTTSQETPDFQGQTDSTGIKASKMNGEKKLAIIQAAFKGYAVRRKYSVDLKRHESQESADIGSTLISEKEYTVPIQYKAEYVTVIRSAFKGYLYRKHISETKSSKPGTVIQSASKGFLYRKYLSKQKKFRQAEAKVRAGFHGYIVRKHFKSLLRRMETDEVETIQVNVQETVNEGNIEKDLVSIIQVAAQSYLKRKHLQKYSEDAHKQKAVKKIQAAFSGYLARKKLQANQNACSPDSIQAGRETLIPVHATKLQAALAAYQTRKVFISLTKLVEDGKTLDVSGHKLERMGSLSETDDFKLKHKSIAKIQTALEEHRQRNVTAVAVTVDGNYSRTIESRHFARSQKPPNRAQLRPTKSTSTVSFARETDSKKRPQIASVKKENKPTSSESRMTKVSRIETYIKLNMAASIVHASLRGYLERKALKKKKEIKHLKRKHSTSPKSGQTGVKQNGRVTARFNNKAEKEVIRSQTASVKVEAERRKEIKTCVAAKESIHAVKLKAEKLRAEKEIKSKSESNTELEAKTSRMNEIISQTNQISEREAVINIDASNTNVDANAIKQGRDFDIEYEVWKEERIDAAVMIQSGWRGYRARKDMLRQEELAVEFDAPQKLIVINIGRSKSEIGRAEQRYNNASMIQMVYRTAKVRRKFKVKMAVKRYERNQAVTKIQAFYRSYATRKYAEERKVATQIQAAFKADFVRKHNVAEKLSQKRNAASLIQATWHSFKTRQRNETEKEVRKRDAEMNSASLSIQSAYRAFRERRSLLKKKIENQKLAASQIQAALRGALFRRTVTEKRLAATHIRASYKSYKTRLELHLLKENLKARNAAATEIVCAYKAHLKREEMRMFKEKMAKEHKAAESVQSTLKGMIARKKEKLRKELVRKQNYSALKIQSFYRGYLGRKMAWVLKTEKVRKEILHNEQCAAALKIQSVYRGHLGRKRARQERYKQELQRTSAEIIDMLIQRTFLYLRQKSLTAVQLQWAVRGHLTRIRNESEKEKRRIEAAERKKKMDVAASMVQTAVRARRRRLQARNAYKLREDHKAATKIQALYRGYSVRQALEREKARLAKFSPLIISPVPDEVLKNAKAIIAFHKNATLLQGVFKAYKTRAQIRDRFHRKIVIVASTPRRENSGKPLTYEDKAAVLIQKTFRGFSDRKVYGKIIKENRKRENKASNIIKACVNGFTLRRKRRILRDKIDREGSPEVRKQKHVAADVIASACRGYQKRKRKLALRVEM